MHKNPKSRGILLLTFFAIVFFMYQEVPAKAKELAVKPPAAATTPDIAYTVSMPKPWTHLLEVEMRLKWADLPAAAELKMRVWTPGSYLVR